MIVGNGMLANALRPHFVEREGVVVFASGVSNSTETRAREFEREERLLTATLAGAPVLYYFSSCGVEDPVEIQRPYMQHKRRMEALVLASPNGRVVRLSQVVGPGGNPNTLTNFISERILSGEAFQVWTHAERNLIDVDDVARLVAAMAEDWPADTRVVSIAATHCVAMPHLVETFERLLGQRGNWSPVDRGHGMVVDTRHAQAVARRVGIDLGNGYTERIIEKYYGPR